MNKIVIDQKESIRIQEKNNQISTTVSELKVNDDITLQKAVGYLQVIKLARQDVESVYKQPKSEASAAHKAIVAEEKKSLVPLDTAESKLKKAIQDYQTHLRQIQMQLEAEARKRREEEAQKLLEQAAQKETDGNDFGAGLDLAMAESISSFAPTVQTSVASAEGLSTRSTWKANVVNEELVPDDVMGIVIRPIDMSALNKIARDSKGKAKIPGVEFYQDSSVFVRG